MECLLFHRWRYSSDINKWVCTKCGATKELDDGDKGYKPHDMETKNKYRGRCRKIKKGRRRHDKMLDKVKKERKHIRADVRGSNRGHIPRGHK